MTAMSQVEVLRAACCIAGADGNVDPQERVLIDKLAAKVGVGKASLEAMVLRSETEPEFYKKQFEVLKLDPRSTMSVLMEVAAEDGKIDPKELTMLQFFAQRLDLDEAKFREVFAQVMRK